jgi:SAM-dependent methyltransferase
MNFRFYHTLELPTLGRQEGIWDLIGRFDEYTGHVPLAGKSVLDVGTSSGYLTWEAETRGATVTSFDVGGPEHYYQLPMQGADRRLEPRAERFLRDRDSYGLAHHDLGSQACCVYGNVYDISPAIGMFDVVLVGQLLVHLPDALNALAAAASVCRETIVVTEGNYPVDAPLASLCARADDPDIAYAWYHYSHGWYREVLAMLGFPTVTITVDSYVCNQADHGELVELATVVGRR